MKIINPLVIFSYVRGAIKGAYGDEELRGKSILVVGMDKQGQELVKRLCIPGVQLYFIDNSIQNYYAAYTVCKSILPYAGVPVDVAIDLNEMSLVINGEVRDFDLDRISDDPYSQGIKDFYFAH